MPYKPYLTIEQADRIIQAARAEAVSVGVAVTICVVDDGANLLRLDRLDGARLVSLRVAQGKACTAVEMQMPTDLVEQVAGSFPSLIAIPNVFPFRGGLPLVCEGICVGGIGVSGGTPEQDDSIARSAAAVLIEP